MCYKVKPENVRLVVDWLWVSESIRLDFIYKLQYLFAIGLGAHVTSWSLDFYLRLSDNNPYLLGYHEN